MIYINGKPKAEGDTGAGVAGVMFTYSLDFSYPFNTMYFTVI